MQARSPIVGTLAAVCHRVGRVEIPVGITPADSAHDSCNIGSVDGIVKYNSGNAYAGLEIVRIAVATMG